MAKNFVQHGKTLSLTAPSGGVVSGTPVLIGGMVVIPQVSAAVGVAFDADLEGVWTLPKVSAQAWTELQVVYWDDTAKNVTTTVGSNTKIGVAAAVATNPSATGKVRLNGTA